MDVIRQERTRKGVPWGEIEGHAHHRGQFPEKIPESPPPGGERQVTVILMPWHVALMDPPLEIVESLLCYSGTNFKPGGSTGVQPFVEEEPWGFDRKGRLALWAETAPNVLSVLNNNGYRVFPSGMVPNVLRILDENGYRVRIVDHREAGPCLSIDPEFYPSGKDGDLLNEVVSVELGQIEVPNRADALEKCCLMCEAFPQARIAVAVATRREARTVWRKLQFCLGEKIALLFSGAGQPGVIAERIVVATFVYIRSGIGGEWDILLLPYGEEAQGWNAIDAITRFHGTSHVHGGTDQDQRIVGQLQAVVGVHEEVLHDTVLVEVGMGELEKRLCRRLLQGVRQRQRRLAGAQALIDLFLQVSRVGSPDVREQVW